MREMNLRGIDLKKKVDKLKEKKIKGKN